MCLNFCKTLLFFTVYVLQSFLSVSQSIDPYYIPLAKGRQKRCSWSCPGTLRGSWRWAMCPCRIQCRRPTSASAGSLASSRTIRPPFWQRPERSRLVQRPRCSGPWPSCFRLPTGRRQSCPDGRFVRMVRSGLSPWFLFWLVDTSLENEYQSFKIQIIEIWNKDNRNLKADNGILK